MSDTTTVRDGAAAETGARRRAKTTPRPVMLDIPNPWYRPRPGPVEILVLHAMGEWVLRDGAYQHCTDLLYDLGLSVHAFCLPDGRLIRSVPPEHVAYHAGEANDRSIGIEVIVAGGHDLAGLKERMQDVANPPYADVQYDTVGWWLRRQAERFRLGFDDVTTHAALDPMRKQDPGAAFDMERLRAAFDGAADAAED